MSKLFYAAFVTQVISISDRQCRTSTKCSCPVPKESVPKKVSQKSVKASLMVAFVALRKVIMGVKQSQFGKCQKFDPDLVLDLIDNSIGNINQCIA